MTSIIISFVIQYILTFLTAIPAGMGLGLGFMSIKKIIRYFENFKQRKETVDKFIEMETI